MLNNFLILIARTFIAAFVIVNLFNIFPINLSSNAWNVQVSMLFVDTASLLLLGFACLKLEKFLRIKNFDVLKGNDSQINKNDFFDKQKNDINKIDKYIKSFIYLFIFIGVLQIFSTFNGLNQINDIAVNRRMLIDKNFEKERTKLISEFNLENNQVNISENSQFNKLTNKKDVMDKQLELSLNKSKVYLYRGSLKVFLMCLVWIYGLYKLSKFRYL